MVNCGSGQLFYVGPAPGRDGLSWFLLSCGVFIRSASSIDSLSGEIGGTTVEMAGTSQDKPGHDHLT
jgi:hypothetical protein